MEEVQAQQSWLDNLPEDLKSNESLQKFKSVEDLAKSYVHAQSLIGRKGVIVPSSDDDPGWDQVYQALGRPDSPDGYELERPEVEHYDEELEKQFRQVAHQAGLSKRQVAQLYRWYLDNYQAKVKEIEQFVQQRRQQAEEVLRKEWGKAYEAKLEAARRVWREFTPENEREAVLEELSRGLGDSPALIKVFARIAEALGEDQLAKGESQAKSYYEQALELTRHPAYIDAGHPDHKRIVEQARELFAKAFPE